MSNTYAHLHLLVDYKYNSKTKESESQSPFGAHVFVHLPYSFITITNILTNIETINMGNAQYFIINKSACPIISIAKTNAVKRPTLQMLHSG